MTSCLFTITVGCYLLGFFCITCCCFKAIRIFKHCYYLFSRLGKTNMGAAEKNTEDVFRSFREFWSLLRASLLGWNVFFFPLRVLTACYVKPSKWYACAILNQQVKLNTLFGLMTSTSAKLLAGRTYGSRRLLGGFIQGFTSRWLSRCCGWTPWQRPGDCTGRRPGWRGLWVGL